MREIKFKAKRKDNGEWVYGYYLKIHNDKDNQILHRIYTGFAEKEVDELFESFYEVIPETICQYTGLKDYNGVEIYENDILQGFEDYYDEFVKGMVDLDLHNGTQLVLEGNSYHLDYIYDYEVIGNVCDKENTNANTTD